MTSDAQDLRKYTALGCEESFRRIVERHGGMVRGVAFRMTGNGATAEDITQSVFIILAKKAAAVEPSRLPGWLHRTASSESLNARRKEVRRLHLTDRYQNEMMTDKNPLSGWEEIAGQLDSAVGKLPAADRKVVILHYFERRNFRQIAAEIGSSEEACRKRSQRALKKLANYLIRQGLRTTAPALAMLMGASPLISPKASAATITATALKVSGGSPGLTLGELIFKIMTIKKIAIGVALVALIGIPIGMKVKRKNQPETEKNVASHSMENVKEDRSSETTRSQRRISKVPTEPSWSPPKIAPFYYESRDWLHSYCPVLTEQEIDLLLERHQQSPETLVALAMLAPARREAILTEAFEKAPDNPLVIAAALKIYKALGISKEELLEKYKLAAPGDAFPDVFLASKVLYNGDRKKAVAHLREAYDKNIYGLLPDLADAQAGLLQEVGRTKEQALLRAFVTKSALADPGPIFASLGTLGSIDTLYSQDAELGLLLLDVSQKLTIADKAPLWRRDFYLNQEESLYRKLSEVADLEKVFYEDPSRLLQAVTAQRESIATFAQTSKAIVPILQRLNNENRKQFVEIASSVSEQSALQWVAQVEPYVFNEVEHLVSESNAWPSGEVFWGSNEK